MRDDRRIIVVCQTSGCLIESFRVRHARQRPQEMLERPYANPSPYPVAVVHLGRGDKDKTFALLEKALQEQSVCIVLTKIDPHLDPLRSDPRYTDLIRRIGFPP
jgi:hypothetical protein